MTLDSDADGIIRRLMKTRGLTFKAALNEAIREGGRRTASRRQLRTKTFDMGPSAFPLDKALRLASELEDEELIRKLALRK